MLAGHFPKDIVKEIKGSKRVEQDITPIVINKHLSDQLFALASAKNKCPRKMAEYFINLGVQTSKFYGNKMNVQFDVDQL